MSKKYNPEEVIQILRVCNSGNNGDCDGCPMRGSADCLDYNNERMALEVIEELAAEVARLRGELIQRNDELLKLQEENRWIPTSERLPDQELEAEPKDADGKPLLGGYECIAQIEGAKRPTALWYCHIDGEGVWTDESGENFYRVTHWKPMPKGSEG